MLGLARPGQIDGSHPRSKRRAYVPVLVVLSVIPIVTALVGCSPSSGAGSTAATTTAATTMAAATTATASASPSAASPSLTDPIAQAVGTQVEKDITSMHLRAVLVKVTIGDKTIVNRAFGPSLTGVPATTDMRFRNGAVAFAYMSNLLLQFVDQGTVTLDDTINKWMPKLPEANKVTLKMLANQTSGYPDFESDAAWTTSFNTDPFQTFTFQRRLDYAFSRPLQFAPGTNWSYSHTNFMILGEILAKIGGRPLATLLQTRVLDPLGLTETISTDTADMPEPVLHSYSSERRVTLGIPAAKPFYEESTYFNSDWGVPTGANQTSTLDDLITSAKAIGTGKLLSKSSYDLMTGPHLLGFGHKLPSCTGACFTQIPAYNYGLGVVRAGNWILQDPLVGGYSATMAYLPAEQIAIAVAVTYLPEAFNKQGVEPNSSDPMFRHISAIVAPNDAAPTG